VLEDAVRAFADLEDPAVVALQGQLARALYLDEEPGRALEVADRALAIAEHRDLISIVADLLVTKGSALSSMGRAYEGVGVLEAGLRLAEAHELHHTAFRARNNIGANLAQRDPRSALAILRAGTTEARRLGSLTWVLSLASNAFACALTTGDWAWVDTEAASFMALDLDTEDRASILATVIGLAAMRGHPYADEMAEFERLLAGATDPGALSAVYDTRAVTALAGGDLDECRRNYSKMLEVSALNVPTVAGTLAQVALWQADPEAARAAADRLEASGAHGPAISARMITIRAGLAALEGRRDEALGLYREALSSWRDAGLIVSEAFAVIDMATLLDPSEPELRAAADVARGILTALDARPFLARLDAAMSRSRTARTADPSSVPDRQAPSPR
jgi:tetratricopeptide (TPR) repeat protein